MDTALHSVLLRLEYTEEVEAIYRSSRSSQVRQRSSPSKFKTGAYAGQDPGQLLPAELRKNVCQPIAGAN